MKRLVALVLGMIGVVGVAIAPASAGQVVGQVSVFPAYRDPWAGWPPRHEHRTVVVPAPGVVVAAPGVVGAPVTQPVWFRGQWAWNGYTWVWIPGHWGYWGY